MKEIDFDELDKAVTSLMGKVEEKTTEDQDKVKTLAINTTLKPDEKPQYDALGKAAEAIGNETLTTDDHMVVEELNSVLPTSQLPVAELDSIKTEEKPEAPNPPTTPTAVPSPAVKRPASGRFMDVVHPSSDMRTASPPPDLVVPDRPSLRFPVKTSQPVVPSVPKKEIEPLSDEETIEEDEPQNKADLVPLTPFLPDTKVEKRPLGAAAPTGPESFPVTNTTGIQKYETPEPVVAGDQDASDAEEPEAAVVESESINSEKSDQDESGDVQRPIDATSFEENASEQEKTLQSIEAVEEKAEGSEVTVRAVESGDTEKLSNGSVAQQYKEKSQTTADEPGGAIYDVKDYHQTIGHPAKQKSGWGVVIIILVIVLVCAALAGAAYFILGMGV